MWVVLLVLSIPPVWPLLKPYIVRISTSHGSSTHRTPGAGGSNNKTSRSFLAHGATPNGWYGAPPVLSPDNAGTKAAHAQKWGTTFNDSDDIVLLDDGIKKSNDAIKVTHEVTVTPSERIGEPQASYKTGKQEWSVV
jgi:hypothetical protein